MLQISALLTNRQLSRGDFPAPCYPPPMRAICVLLILLMSVVPSWAGMYRLHGLNFRIVLDDSCVRRDATTSNALWVDCPNGLNVTFLVRWMPTYNLPKLGTPEAAELTPFIPGLAKQALAQTEWENLLPRLDWGGGASRVEHTVEGAGNLCPSLVSKHVCSYEPGAKAAALRAVQTNQGTIVLIAIGDRVEPQPGIPAIALPESALAMIGSFTRGIDW